MCQKLFKPSPSCHLVSFFPLDLLILTYFTPQNKISAYIQLFFPGEKMNGLCTLLLGYSTDLTLN